jgi:conjugative transfer signal peptidase TraF
MTILIIILLLIAAGVIQLSGIIINISPSMPLGIYVKKLSPLQRGDVVAVCLDAARQKLGLQRGYLIPGFRCGQTQPLIKKIIAIPGDRVVLTDEIIRVNGKSFFYRRLPQDHQGLPLEAFPTGIYAPTHAYWLLGVYNTHSWDSRYWGPLPGNYIIENLQPLITWTHSSKLRYCWLEMGSAQ